MYEKHIWPTDTQLPTRVNQKKGPLHPPGGPPNEGCFAIKKYLYLKKNFVYIHKSQHEGDKQL